MQEYLIMTFMSLGIIGLSIRLVSKRHHCEKLTTLFWFMLIFMCFIDLQFFGGSNSRQVRIFWSIAVVLGGAALAYDATSAKTYYYLKDFQVGEEEHREALENLLRRYQMEHLPLEAKVKMDYRLLVLENVPAADEKACLGLINDYINTHDCSDIKDWRFMILFAATLQLIVVIGMTIYHFWQGY